jgi:hypothetical protein
MLQEHPNQSNAIDIMTAIKANVEACKRYQTPDVLQMLEEAEKTVSDGLRADLCSLGKSKNDGHIKMLQNGRIASLESLLPELWATEENKKKPEREKNRPPYPKNYH